MVIPTIIFLAVYLLIISEKLNRVVAALSGASIMLLFKFISQQEAFSKIDFNTIGLLVSMMIIVNITKRSGVFEYVAIKAAKLSKGNPITLLVVFSLITFIFSALLDNVTTVLLLVPVTLVVTKTLNTNPIPFLMSEILSSNIGGTATLIGDPPNIMIGSAANLTFMDFIINLSPIVIVIFIVNISLIKYIYKKDVHTTEEKKQIVMNLDESKTITDEVLLKKSLIVLAFTFLGFILHGFLGFDSSTVAIVGSSILLLISKTDPEEILQEVEWGTLFFFIGLFIMTGVLEKVGLMNLLATKALSLTKGNLLFSSILVLWISAIASSFIDNIPFVATMIPLIKVMSIVGHMNVLPLWLALSLGSCLGGNGTIVGASANLIVIGIAGKSGHTITFKDYFRVGFPLMLISICISTVYLLVFYL
ncbi:membrane protein [Clostridium novyi B str. ATCC 27606]|uniref:Membrane protein n=2 Tax=Clostridium TaxID=1485 RepID=A0AA40IUA7_CLONO|nr:MULTISPECIES: ArsB/NhaD family transporter [Clostridium]KEI12552.1 membrane protein [Clostridium novyi B str. NCTC 9691]KEI16328.1 membrane protein [Clostridium novyi B str. ATCC 27606]KEI18523.1 membrane protein [Clostridium haemolyticum NCTC 9693]KGN04546.1 membrane protein [Clostridium haemolyticum NCTC 8350]CAG7840165.1 putative transporter [Clostridium haemolyticum]